MSAGAGGTGHGVLTSCNQGGGNKKQGLVSTTNTRVALDAHIRIRGGGHNRNWLFCMNQLGGVGRRWGQAAGPGNRGGVSSNCQRLAYRRRQQYPPKPCGAQVRGWGAGVKFPSLCRVSAPPQPACATSPPLRIGFTWGADFGAIADPTQGGDAAFAALVVNACYETSYTPFAVASPSPWAEELYSAVPCIWSGEHTFICMKSDQPDYPPLKWQVMAKGPVANECNPSLSCTCDDCCDSSIKDCDDCVEKKKCIPSWFSGATLLGTIADPSGGSVVSTSPLGGDFVVLSGVPGEVTEFRIGTLVAAPAPPPPTPDNVHWWSIASPKESTIGYSYCQAVGDGPSLYLDPQSPVLLEGPDWSFLVVGQPGGGESLVRVLDAGPDSISPGARGGRVIPGGDVENTCAFITAMRGDGPCAQPGAGYATTMVSASYNGAQTNVNLTLGTMTIQLAAVTPPGVRPLPTPTRSFYPSWDPQAYAPTDVSYRTMGATPLSLPRGGWCLDLPESGVGGFEAAPLSPYATAPGPQTGIGFPSGPECRGQTHSSAPAFTGSPASIPCSNGPGPATCAAGSWSIGGAATSSTYKCEKEQGQCGACLDSDNQCNLDVAQGCAQCSDTYKLQPGYPPVSCCAAAGNRGSYDWKNLGGTTCFADADSGFMQNVTYYDYVCPTPFANTTEADWKCGEEPQPTSSTACCAQPAGQPTAPCAVGSVITAPFGPLSRDWWESVGGDTAGQVGVVGGIPAPTVAGVAPTRASGPGLPTSACDPYLAVLQWAATNTAARKWLKYFFPYMDPPSPVICATDTGTCDCTYDCGSSFCDCDAARTESCCGPQVTCPGQATPCDCDSNCGNPECDCDVARTESCCGPQVTCPGQATPCDCDSNCGNPECDCDAARTENCCGPQVTCPGQATPCDCDSNCGNPECECEAALAYTCCGPDEAQCTGQILACDCEDDCGDSVCDCPRGRACCSARDPIDPPPSYPSLVMYLPAMDAVDGSGGLVRSRVDNTARPTARSLMGSDAGTLSVFAESTCLGCPTVGLGCCKAATGWGGPNPQAALIDYADRGCIGVTSAMDPGQPREFSKENPQPSDKLFVWAVSWGMTLTSDFKFGAQCDLLVGAWDRATAGDVCERVYAASWETAPTGAESASVAWPGGRFDAECAWRSVARPRPVVLPQGGQYQRALITIPAALREEVQPFTQLSLCSVKLGEAGAQAESHAVNAAQLRTADPVFSTPIVVAAPQNAELMYIYCVTVTGNVYSWVATQCVPHQPDKLWVTDPTITALNSTARFGEVYGDIVLSSDQKTLYVMSSLGSVACLDAEGMRPKWPPPAGTCQ